MSSPEVMMLDYLAWIDSPVAPCTGKRRVACPHQDIALATCRDEARRLGFERAEAVTPAGRAWAMRFVAPSFRLMGLANDGRRLKGRAA